MELKFNRYTFIFAPSDGIHGVIYVKYNNEIRAHFTVRPDSPNYNNQEVFEAWCKEYLEFE
ncbi:MAG: hypothetical protein ACRC1P_05055 [Cellulosilyticaceae bacterium]